MVVQSDGDHARQPGWMVVQSDGDHALRPGWMVVQIYGDHALRPGGSYAEPTVIFTWTQTGRSTMRRKQ
jgi:hypothetical protein